VTTQSAVRAEWRRGLELAAEEAARIAGSLTDEQLHWNPPGGGWSVAQVLDHLSQTNEEYLRVIGPALADARTASASGAEWRPSLAGRLLAHAMRSPRKGPAPRVFRPVPQPGERPVERFQQSVRVLLDALQRSERADLQRTRIRSPAARLIRMNLGDGFRLQVMHAERHLGQIQRVAARPEFPR
jgi:hypothetical protein